MKILVDDNPDLRILQAIHSLLFGVFVCEVDPVAPVICSPQKASDFIDLYTKPGDPYEQR